MAEPKEIEELCDLFDKKTNIKIESSDEIRVDDQTASQNENEVDQLLTVSRLSHYFVLQCGEFLRLSVNHRAEGKYSEDVVSSSKKQRGILFEQRLKEYYSDEILEDIHDENQFLSYLKSSNLDEGQCRIGYNIKFRWYYNNYLRSNYKPDFLLVRRKSTNENRLEITIADAKSSADLSIEHCVQVGLYSIDLRVWIERNKIDQQVFINDFGEIWLPSDDPTIVHRKKVFPLGKLRIRLENSLNHELPTVFNDNKRMILPRCNLCPYSSYCRRKVRQEEVNSINNLSYLNVSSHLLVEFYLGSTRLDSSRIKSVLEQFDKNPIDLDVNNKLKLEKVLAIEKQTGTSLALKALEENQPQIKITSNRYIPKPTKNGHLLLLTVISDPSELHSVALFAAHQYNITEQTWSTENSFIKRNPSSFEIVSLVARSVESIQEQSSTCQIVFFDEQERSCLIDQLIIGSDNPDIEHCLVLIGLNQNTILLEKPADILPFDEMYPDPTTSQLSKVEVLDELEKSHGIFYHDEIPNKSELVKQLTTLNEKIKLEARKSLIKLANVICLHTVIRNCFVIPAPGYFDLEDLNSLFKINYPFQNLNRILTEIDSPDIHEIVRQRVELLACLFVSIQKTLSEKNCLHFEADQLPKMKPIQNFRPNIRRLIFLRQYELLSSLLSHQQSRFHSDEPPILIKVEQKIPIDQYKTFWRCQIQRGQDIILKTSTENVDNANAFRNFPFVIFEKYEKILNFTDAVHMDLFIDGPRSTKLDGCGLVNIEKIDDDGSIQIYLKCSGIQVRIGQEYGLVERYIDFNTKKSIQSLREATQLTMNIFDNPILLNKSQINNQIPEAVQDEVMKMFSSVKSTLNVDGLNPLNEAQKQASEKVKHQRVTLVWGPPGTGKTYWSAITIFQLLLLSQSPIRILVTACTHAAIDNLLTSINFVKERLLNSSSFGRAKKLANDLIVLKLDSKSNNNTLLRRAPIVVGATCWRLYKVEPSFKFHVILVDESTQLLTCDSALILNRLEDQKNSRLIVAGDPLQLPPIKRCTYPPLPDFEPDLFSSLFHCLLRDSENHPITLESDNPFREMSRCPHLTIFNENHRMNENLSNFTRLLYGENYIPGYPKPYLSIRPSTPSEENILGSDFNLSSSLYTLMIQAPKRNMINAQTDVDLESTIVIVLIKEILKRVSLSSIFVIVPHRIQRTAIKQKLQSQRFDDVLIDCDTVERMQGKEADCVLLCMLFRQRSLLEEELNFIYNRQRINVSITRAKQLCFLITSDIVLNEVPFNLFAINETRNAFNLLVNFLNKSKVIHLDNSGRRLK